MLNAIITILMTLNIQYSLLDNQSLSLKHEDCFKLTSSNEFQRLIDTGTESDIIVIPGNDGQLNDIVIVPEVDPISKD